MPDPTLTPAEDDDQPIEGAEPITLDRMSVERPFDSAEYLDGEPPVYEPDEG